MELQGTLWSAAAACAVDERAEDKTAERCGLTMDSRSAGGVWQDNICMCRQHNTKPCARAASHNSELFVVLAHPQRDAAIVPATPAHGRAAVRAAQAAVTRQQPACSIGGAASGAPFLIQP